MENYKKSIAVNNTAAEVFNAITQHIPDWWSDDFAGAAANIGDQYNIVFGETRKTFEIVEVSPNEKIVWLCKKAYIDMDALTKKDEWVGTKIIWTISQNNDGTILTMQHDGLNKAVECYEICEPAWDYFMASIQNYLNTGAGTPYHKKEARLEWEEKE